MNYKAQMIWLVAKNAVQAYFFATGIYVTKKKFDLLSLKNYVYFLLTVFFFAFRPWCYFLCIPMFHLLLLGLHKEQ